MPGEVLHVTNGESVASTLGETSLGGVVVAWNDVLHEGPLADVPADQLRPLRAGFLAAQGWGDATAIAEEMRRRDELFARALADAHPVVLWFEQDLFDQLQLLQVLATIPEGSGSIELVQADDYLGALTAEELEALWQSRRPVTPAIAALGRAGWKAVCSDEIEPFLRRDTTALPYLAPALTRLLEEREPLARTDRQLLEALARGPAAGALRSQPGGRGGGLSRRLLVLPAPLRAHRARARRAGRRRADAAAAAAWRPRGVHGRPAAIDPGGAGASLSVCPVPRSSSTSA